MIEHRFIQGADALIHIACEGPSDGAPVVLLHGFPEAWSCWRAQMSALAAAGFRAIAPDLRGYGESDKPRGVEHYKSSLIADDIAAVIRRLATSGERISVPVIAHDWGAMIAYRLAMDHAELVSRLVIMNGPHPLHFSRVLRASSAQRRRSWYTLFFQLPILPEVMLRRRSTLEKIFDGVISEEELRAYELAFARPYATTAALNYYRAALTRDREPRDKVFDKDVLVVWGMRDVALGPECVDGLERWLPRVRIERIDHAGHFVQHEAASEVNAILLRELPGGGKVR